MNTCVLIAFKKFYAGATGVCSVIYGYVLSPSMREAEHDQAPRGDRPAAEQTATSEVVRCDCKQINRKRYELPRPPGGYDRVLKRVGIQY
jgi:hypothetical protein